MPRPDMEENATNDRHEVPERLRDIAEVFLLGVGEQETDPWELPRRSSTRYGPLLEARRACDLYRDHVSKMYPIRPEEFTVDSEGCVVFRAPQLTFACRCLTEEMALALGVMMPAEVEAFFAEGGDLTMRWETAYPGTLPHVATCFHRVFCRVSP